MSATYHLSRNASQGATQETWTLHKHDRDEKVDLGLFGSKEIGTKVLKALKAGKITEDKAREMGRSFKAARHAKAAKTGHVRREPVIRELDDPRYPVLLRMLPESENDAVLLAQRLRRRKHKIRLTRAEAPEGARECRLKNPAQLADLIEAIEGGTDAHVLMQTLDLAQHFTGDRLEGSEARGERIMALLDAVPEKIRKAYLSMTGQGMDASPSPFD